MKNKLQTEQFLIEYTESNNTDPVFWESHCHAQFEMIAVLEGEVSIMAEGRCYRLSEHQAVIVPPLLYHTVSADKKGAYRRVTALFDVNAIPVVLREHFSNKNSEFNVMHAREAEELRRICRLGDTALYGPLAQALMIGLFYRDIEVKHTENTAETDVFLQKIISYIDSHLCERIRLCDLAELTARSKSSLCHLFEQKMAISPKQYIMQKKLAFASKLIRDGVPPTEAAVQIGYENYSNFYRMYVKHLGTEPSCNKKQNG